MGCCRCGASITSRVCGLLCAHRRKTACLQGGSAATGCWCAASGGRCFAALRQARRQKIPRCAGRSMPSQNWQPARWHRAQSFHAMPHRPAMCGLRLQVQPAHWAAQDVPRCGEAGEQGAAPQRGTIGVRLNHHVAALQGRHGIGLAEETRAQHLRPDAEGLCQLQQLLSVDCISFITGAGAAANQHHAGRHA